jgi:hypothetical protein
MFLPLINVLLTSGRSDIHTNMLLFLLYAIEDILTAKDSQIA